MHPKNSIFSSLLKSKINRDSNNGHSWMHEPLCLFMPDFPEVLMHQHLTNKLCINIAPILHQYCTKMPSLLDQCATSVLNQYSINITPMLYQYYTNIVPILNQYLITHPWPTFECSRALLSAHAWLATQLWWTNMWPIDTASIFILIFATSILYNFAPIWH